MLLLQTTTEHPTLNESYLAFGDLTETINLKTILTQLEEEEKFCEYSNMYLDIINFTTWERFARIPLIKFAQRVNLSNYDVRIVAAGRGWLELEATLWVGFSEPTFEKDCFVPCKHVFEYYSWDNEDKGGIAIVPRRA